MADSFQIFGLQNFSSAKLERKCLKNDNIVEGKSQLPNLVSLVGFSNAAQSMKQQDLPAFYYFPFSI